MISYNGMYMFSIESSNHVSTTLIRAFWQQLFLLSLTRLSRMDQKGEYKCFSKIYFTLKHILDDNCVGHQHLFSYKYGQRIL